jgi:hypothetical protein
VISSAMRLASPACSIDTVIVCRCVRRSSLGRPRAARTRPRPCRDRRAEITGDVEGAIADRDSARLPDRIPLRIIPAPQRVPSPRHRGAANDPPSHSHPWISASAGSTPRTCVKNCRCADFTNARFRRRRRHAARP